MYRIIAQPFALSIHLILKIKRTFGYENREKEKKKNICYPSIVMYIFLNATIFFFYTQPYCCESDFRSFYVIMWNFLNTKRLVKIKQPLCTNFYFYPFAQKNTSIHRPLLHGEYGAVNILTNVILQTRCSWGCSINSLVIN